LVGLNVSGRRALLRFRGDRERVEALAAGERTCCASLELTTTADGDDTELEIVAPEGGEPFLRGLVAGIVAGWDTGLAQR
jgi:hypothetical protein